MQTSSSYSSKRLAAASVNTPAPDDGQLVDLGHLANILWYRRYVIAACIGAAIACALVYIAVTPSIYTARAVLLVDPREMRLTDADEVLSGIGSDSAAITSQVAVMQSRELLTAVMEAENIFADREFATSGVENRNTTFENFLRHLSVERQGLTYVIEVAFTSHDREKSARISNAIVSEYIKDQVSEKSRANSDVTGMLEGQIDGLRKSVSAAEAAVEAFKVKNGMLDMGSGRTLLQSQVEQLNLQVLAARERARFALIRYNQAKSLQPVANALVSNGDILSSPAAEQLRNEYNERSIELSRLANIYGQRHPRLVEQKLQIEQLKTLMDAETGRIIRRLEGELNVANQDTANAEKELSNLRTQADEAAQNEIELRQLEMQARSSREVLEQFMRRSKETGQLDNLQRSEVRIISMAVPPPRATWPRPTLMLAVASFLGAVFGLALALLMGHPAEVTKSGPVGGDGDWRRYFRNKIARVPGSTAPRGIPLLGRLTSSFAVPRTTTGSYHQSTLIAAKREFSASPTSEFSVQLWSMIGKLFDRLPERNGPFLITFCDKAGETEACRLSYNTAACLERLRASVLLLDLHPQSNPPRRRRQRDLFEVISDPQPFNRESLIDFATGLPVIALHNDNQLPGDNVELDADAVDLLLAKAAGRFDFIVVHGLPWRERKQMQVVIDRSAQLVVVLTEAENNEQQLTTLIREVSAGVPVSYAVMETAASMPIGKRSEARSATPPSLAARIAHARQSRGR